MRANFEGLCQPGEWVINNWHYSVLSLFSPFLDSFTDGYWWCSCCCSHPANLLQGGRGRQGKTRQSLVHPPPEEEILLNSQDCSSLRGWAALCQGLLQELHSTAQTSPSSLRLPEHLSVTAESQGAFSPALLYNISHFSRKVENTWFPLLSRTGMWVNHIFQT